MNNSELNDLLRRASVPDRNAAGWKELSDETLRAIRQSTRPEMQTSAHPAPRLLVRWSVGFAVVCILIGFAVGHWHARREMSRSEIADARRLFAELSAIFPNRLEAVVLDGSSPRLILAESTTSTPGTSLFVRICGPQGCQRIIALSGQRLRVNGESFEVLLDGRGNVIVTGDTFAWSSAEREKRAGQYRIQAAPLTEVL